MRTEKEIRSRLTRAQLQADKYFTKGNDRYYLAWRTVVKELRWVLKIGTNGINSRSIKKDGKCRV